MYQAVSCRKVSNGGMPKMPLLCGEAFCWAGARDGCLGKCRLSEELTWALGTTL